MGLMSLREFRQSFTLVAPENAGQGFSAAFGGCAISMMARSSHGALSQSESLQKSHKIAREFAGLLHQEERVWWH